MSEIEYEVRERDVIAFNEHFTGVSPVLGAYRLIRQNRPAPVTAAGMREMPAYHASHDYRPA